MNSKRDCNTIAEQYYPSKISLYEFVQILQKNVEPFENNMEKFHINDELKWPEEWMEMFTRWMELTKKNNKGE